MSLAGVDIPDRIQESTRATVTAGTGAAVLYGIGLALTFDEFGMWLHLGGGYWQRASFDAVTVVVGLLVLMAFAPPFREIRGRHAITILILLLLGAGFFFMLFQTVNKYGGKMQPR